MRSSRPGDNQFFVNMDYCNAFSLNSFFTIHSSGRTEITLLNENVVGLENGRDTWRNSL